jgi:ATP-dependent helicase/nuclease subunit B
VSGPGLFAAPPPRWFTIPAHRPFLDDLARGLLEALGEAGLAEAVVLLPSRRSAGALADAFLRASERGSGASALLLPQVRALGDLEEGEPPFEAGELSLELPAAISPYRRRFELARLVSAHEELLRRPLGAAAALEMADALGRFLDSVEIEEVAEGERLERLNALVPAELAEHWQISADFLAVALEAWPRRLSELGLIDVATRRVRLLRALAEGWRRNPPQGPLIAAGSTGTAKANAELLAVIAAAPMGLVVLPGLDLELADKAWQDVGEQHPQGGMRRLIAGAQIDRSDVRPWPASQDSLKARWRRRIVNEALRPPEATADWMRTIGELRREGDPADDPIALGLDGLTVLAARTEEEAACVAALLMREVLETPGKTCALVTPDQALARRVSSRLSRWGVEVDSSAGSPLANAAAGVLAGLVLAWLLDPAGPVPLLAVLKHPLVRLGLDEPVLDRARSALERHALRGARGQSPDWMAQRLADAALPRERQEETPAHRQTELSEAARLLGLAQAALELARSPYTGETATPAEAARGLAAALERLCADAEGRTGSLWGGPVGEKTAELIAALINDSQGLPEVGPRDFARLLETLISDVTVRAGRDAHPRLKILGALESRLVTADRLILAGLEEGVWPQPAPTDPFLSRPMRAAFGLPPPERRIGLSAHDFAQAACAPEVVLLHAERRDGAPAVPSRWLWRLRTLAKGAALELPGRPELLEAARTLDVADEFAPAPRPRPCPPVEVRPDELSVTRVETWLRDPYAVYARYVLDLKPLDRPDEPVEARARGIAVHLALQQFTELHPEALPEDAAEQLEALMVSAMVGAGMGSPAMAREQALARQAASWLVGFERSRRTGDSRLLVERQGALVIPAPGGDFVLTARADRIEVSEGAAHLLDFKTGTPPSRRQVQVGLNPQLTLTAAMIARGAFADVEPRQPGELLYVHVTGRTRQKPPLLVAGQGDSGQWAEAALEGLTRRVGLFRLRETAYLSWCIPQFMHRRGGDYDHLARVWEWYVIGDDEETA